MVPRGRANLTSFLDKANASLKLVILAGDKPKYVDVGDGDVNWPQLM
jgi:hypothetical protein